MYVYSSTYVNIHESANLRGTIIVFYSPFLPPTPGAHRPRPRYVYAPTDAHEFEIIICGDRLYSPR